MSKLNKHVNNKLNKKVTATARVPKIIYDQFKKHCSDLGISINEAINILIEEELNALPSTEEREIKKPFEEEYDENFCIVRDDENCYYHDGKGVAAEIEAREWAMINAMKPENQKIDPNDPIEQAIREQEILYGNKPNKW